MRFFLIAISLCVFNLFLAQKNIQYVRFSGNIINHNGEEVKIYGGNKYLKVMKLNEDGSFSDTLHVKKGLYTFRDKKEITPIYLAPGYDLIISLDTKEFDETIIYSGIGSENNTYLAKLFLYKEQNSVSYNEKSTYSEEEYYNYIINLNNGALQLLTSMDLEDKEFILFQKKKNHFETMNNLLNHKKKETFLDNRDSSVIARYLLKEFEQIDFDDSLAFINDRAYKFLLLSYYKYGLISDDNDVLVNFQDIKNVFIKEAILNSLDRSISIKTENNELYYNTLNALSTDTAFINAYTTKYNKLLKLKTGNPSPSFTYENYNGQTSTLDDFKGSLLYIDVWATWCGPCKIQIPFLNKLEEKYKDNNISFVSISIDNLKDIDKWRQMIKEKEMDGVQLIAENAWNSEFAVAYSVKGIPRFILIDADGDIINANAPRPMHYNIDGDQELNNEIIS